MPRRAADRDECFSLLNFLSRARLRRANFSIFNDAKYAQHFGNRILYQRHRVSRVSICWPFTSFITVKCPVELSYLIYVDLSRSIEAGRGFAASRSL